MFGKGFRHKHSQTRKLARHEIVSGLEQVNRDAQNELIDISSKDFLNAVRTRSAQTVSTEAYSADELNQALSTPFSKTIERMRFMEDDERVKTMDMLAAASSMSINGLVLGRHFTNHEVRRGPDYWVYDSRQPQLPSYYLSQSPNFHEQSTHLDMAWGEETEQKLNDLRDRGFVYVRFLGNLATEDV